MSKKKYTPEKKILSVDELLNLMDNTDNLYCVVCDGKSSPIKYRIYHKGWIVGWQLRYAQRKIKQGQVFIAKSKEEQNVQFTPFTGTNEQRENLTILQGYLSRGRSALKAEFDMGLFSDKDEDWIWQCGSVGCMIGHGPYAGIEKPLTENWMEYSKRCFTDNAPEWDFLFHGKWANIASDPEDGAARINLLLTKGLPTTGVSEESQDEADKLWANIPA